jgi:DNA-binding NtrC family response regulator
MGIHHILFSNSLKIERIKTVGDDGSKAMETMNLKKLKRVAAKHAERGLIRIALNETSWNRKKAAEILGVSYKALLY